MRFIVIGMATLALAACNKPTQQPTGETPPATEVGPHKGVDRSHKGEAAPTAKFIAPDGDEASIAEMRGPVLVNLWASWCAPCIKELPTLNALALSHNEDGALGVVAVSQDSGSQESVLAFMDKLKVEELGAYQDPKMVLSGALGPDTVLPTSILYDAHGKEVWRYVGDLDWTGPEAAKLLAEGGVSPKGG